MNNQDDQHQTQHQAPSTLQPMVIIFGLCLVLATIVAIILAKPVEEVATPVANVEQNIKPEAVVEVAPMPVAHEEKSGAEVVQASCAACHATGMLNAPKFGDKAQWAPRIALGYETLVKHAIEGIRGMPARGGNADLTDDEVASAVAEMANGAGANFKFVKSAN
jgi:cytochrome c5